MKQLLKLFTEEIQENQSVKRAHTLDLEFSLENDFPVLTDGVVSFSLPRAIEAAHWKKSSNNAMQDIANFLNFLKDKYEAIICVESIVKRGLVTIRSIDYILEEYD